MGSSGNSGMSCIYSVEQNKQFNLKFDTYEKT